MAREILTDRAISSGSGLIPPAVNSASGSEPEAGARVESRARSIRHTRDFVRDRLVEGMKLLYRWRSLSEPGRWARAPSRRVSSPYVPPYPDSEMPSLGHNVFDNDRAINSRADFRRAARAMIRHATACEHGAAK